MSFPRYPEYKESGVEWLGVVPRPWDIVPLKHLVDFINGCAFKPGEWSNSGTPIIRIENLNGGEDFNFFDGEIDHRYRVIQGELLFGWSGNRGTSFGPFLWEKPGAYLLNQHIFKVVSGVHQRKWFYWCLKAVTAHVEEQAHGIIGMVHVTKGDLGAIKVPVPVFEEQSTIADFLDWEAAKIDALVAEQEKLIDLLKEKRQAVISHAVTKGLDPDVPMKDSGVEWLGQVPVHWSVAPLKRLAALVTGMTPPTNDPENYSEEGEAYPWIRPEDINESGIETVASKFLTHKGWELSRPVFAGSTLICCIGTIGKTGIINKKSATNQQITAAIFFKSPRYFFYALASAKKSMEIAATGNVLRILNTERLGMILIPSPPEDEANSISTALDDVAVKIDALIAESQRAIDLLKERRAALISAAVTGKIDVRTFHPELTEAA